MNYKPLLFYLEKSKYGNQNIINSASIITVAESLKVLGFFNVWDNVVQIISFKSLISATYMKVFEMGGF